MQYLISNIKRNALFRISSSLNTMKDQKVTGLLALFMKVLYYFDFFSNKAKYKLRPISGDEILAINGKSLQGLSHDEAINEFRAIKQGPVILRVAKREQDQEPIVIVKE